jgi:mannose-6-phosphate isomerase-like protein (cupin superfamily)
MPMPPNGLTVLFYGRENFPHPEVPEAPGTPEEMWEMLKQYGCLSEEGLENSDGVVQRIQSAQRQYEQWSKTNPTSVGPNEIDRIAQELINSPYLNDKAHELFDTPFTSDHGWNMKQLPRDPDVIAVDTAEIRKVFQAEEASVVHCTLPPKAVSVATRLVDIHEIWYFIEGRGRVWLKEEQETDGEEKEIGPGTCFFIPAGVHFQYRNVAREPLTFLCVTMPPFQSQKKNNEKVKPHWEQE